MVTYLIAGVVKRLKLGVLGDIDQNRAWAAGTRYVECLGQCHRDFTGVGNLVVPFGNRGGDVNHIGFLESVGSEEVCKYLSGDADNRVAIDHCVSKASYQVGSSRATGGKNHAHA